MLVKVGTMYVGGNGNGGAGVTGAGGTLSETEPACVCWTWRTRHPLLAGPNHGEAVEPLVMMEGTSWGVWFPGGPRSPEGGSCQ